MMHSILTTAKGITFTDFDHSLYEHTKHKMARMFGEEHSTLFANILFMLTHRQLVDGLLKILDAEIKTQWDKEKNLPHSTLHLHRPKAYLSFVSLRWPVATPELASNHSHHLLSRVLLQTEQRHGINTVYAKSAPIPTFMGFVPTELSTHVFKRNRLWNDDSRIAGLFYHGKMTHRIQWYMLIKAIETGLLDIGRLTVTSLLKLCLTPFGANPHTNNPGEPPWDRLFDYDVTNNNIILGYFPLLEACLTQYPQSITSNRYDQPYVYACDPAFFHSYLMSASRKQTPYLSECVTKIFCKSALTIRHLEEQIGLKLYAPKHLLAYPLHDDVPAIYEKLESDELTMKGVYQRQEMSFNAFGYHAVDTREILDNQAETGSDRQINPKRSLYTKHSCVQYRLLKHPPQTELPESSQPAPYKRLKRR